jgi:hypothetical protein
MEEQEEVAVQESKNTRKKTRISKVASCIRKTANTSRMSGILMPDNPSFNISGIHPELSMKFTHIINKIKDLDAEDMRTHGTLFKHFIFTDIRESAYGVKAFASFLIKAGFDLRMKLQEKHIKRGGVMVKTAGGDTVYVKKDAVPNGCNGFAMLQSLPLWKNPLSVATKKDIIKAFNARPDNVHGEQLRIIVLDSKFKEGIDLFDVKYVHLVEPAIASSDLKQAVGRATRFCGQKGLHFLPRRGWPLHVFIYNTELPNREPFKLSDDDVDSIDAHSLMMAKSGLDVALLNLTKELTILAIKSAVDYDLNYKINNYKIEESLLDAANTDTVVVEQSGGGKLQFHTLESLTPDLLQKCAGRKSALFPFTVPELHKAALDLGLKVQKKPTRQTYCQMMAETPAYLNYLISLQKPPTPAPPTPHIFTEPSKRSSRRSTPLPPTKKTLRDLLDLPTDEFQHAVSELYAKYQWDSPIIKNGCEAIAAPGQQGKPVIFTKTQDFIRHYLTPESPFKGLLAWHSVGTGKTCMAVAAATSHFETAGYTILWVTRNSLMSDVYKNIFGSVCSIPIMKAVEDGKSIPSDLSKAKRMLSRLWSPPISYRTFQNALQKKNELGRLLYKKNATDPLHKTFLIMDEVHKLQDGDLSASEAADFGIIQNYIHKSYTTSGAESVRPLLMTATPITDTPKELFEILNTLIADPERRLSDFKSFREDYTNENGDIRPEGVTYFQERVRGLISYLNREFDPTTFAQPIFHNERVVLRDPTSPSVGALVDKCLQQQPDVAAEITGQRPLDSYIIESIVEQDCTKGFEKELEDIDDEITKVETEISELGEIGRKKNAETRKKREVKDELKTRIVELKKLFIDTKKKQTERKRQCELANKESNEVMKRLELLARKKKKGGDKKAIDKLVTCYKAEKERFIDIYKNNQLASIQKCFTGKIPAAKHIPFVTEKEFRKEIKNRQSGPSPRSSPRSSKHSNANTRKNSRGSKGSRNTYKSYNRHRRSVSTHSSMPALEADE